MLIDEAHHVLPAERDPSITALPTVLFATVFVTVDPPCGATVRRRPFRCGNENS
jgi:hypothetical protein